MNSFLEKGLHKSLNKGRSAAALLVGLVLSSSPALSAKFANQFVEFELPPQWECSLEGAEWVCQSTNESRKRDAIIILAAKIKGDQDSLDQYQNYLKSGKTFTSVHGKPIKSDPKYTKTIQLNGHPWIDSLHLESEIPGFYTRYLATIKTDIGVLVTYSIAKEKYQQYLDQFETMIKTLKVFRKPGVGLNTASQGSIFSNTQIPANVQSETLFPGVNPQGGATDTQQPAPKKNDDLFVILIAVAAGLVFIMIRRKKKG